MNLQDVLTTDLSKIENPEAFVETALKFQPVSYTHLDVYKRQQMAMALLL